MANVLTPKMSIADPDGLYEDESSDTGLITGSVTPLVKDSGGAVIENLAKDLDLRLDEQTKDYLMQYYLDEKKAQNTQLRQSQAERDYYPNLIAGLQKAGLNPMLALSGLSGGGTGASSGSTTGGLFTSSANSKRQAAANTGSKMLQVLSMIAMAIIGFIAAA